MLSESLGMLNGSFSWGYVASNFKFVTDKVAESTPLYQSNLGTADKF